MGTIINAIAILVGGGLGLLFRRGFSERIAQTALQVMGLFTFVVGMTMAPVAILRSVGARPNQRPMVIVKR